MNLTDYKMRVTDTHVYFWGGPGSQWFKSDFEASLPYVVGEGAERRLRRSEDRMKFTSAEKFMMMGKASVFDDRNSLRRMEVVNDVARLKAYGREVQGFSNEVWGSVNMPIVTVGSYCKMTQSDALWAFMTEMAGREFVEGSPKDRIWGVGLSWDDPKIEDRKNWRGENRLGRCLNMAWQMMLRWGRDADPYQAYAQLVREGVRP